MDEPITASATATIYIVFALSLIAIFVASARKSSGKPLLEYEPRQRVPWGMAAIIVPILCVVDKLLMPLFVALFSIEVGDIEIDPQKFVVDCFALSTAMIGFVIVAIPWMAIVCGATARDLGLPANLRQLGRDIGIGIFACLASFLPVLSLQNLLTYLFEPEQNHQLIDLILEHKSPQLLMAGFVIAVIAAPIFEEFAFRLLLQGWLERREDEQLGIKETERQTLDADNSDQTPSDNYEAETIPDSESKIPTEVGNPEVVHSTDAPPEPLEISRNLPHGWTPILISGIAFGLAHLGQGVAPIPLILLGIVLGYLYQRTHRLAPCIVAHALFNAYSMTILWLQIG